MMKKTLCLLAGSLLMIGCGSRAPGVDRVRSDLDNPTGSVSDKSAVTAAAQRQSGGGATSNVGSVNPFGGVGLTAVGKTAQLDPMIPLQPFFTHVEHQMGRSLRLRQGLRASQSVGGFDDCFAQAFSGAGISGDAGNFKASVDVDFDTCSVEGFSGRLSMDMSGSVNARSGAFSMKANYVYDQLCITSGDIKVCQDGDMQMEGDGSVTGSDVQMNIIAGWYFDTTMTSAGKTRQILNKGGLEMAFGANDNGASGTFRMVIYLSDRDGNELTYTLTVKLEENGDGSFTITGKDGTLTCNLTGEAGSCTGDGNLEWTESDWEEAFDIYGGL